MTSDVELEMRLEQAVLFISNAAQKNERYRGLFLLHSIRVGLYLQAQGYDEEIALAGFLHDVIEDTSVTLDEVQATFGETVAKLVAANTNNMDLPRLERDDESLARCIQIGEPAVLVNFADTRDNLETYLKTADPTMMDWLRSHLKHMLDETRSLLSDQPVWRDIQKQYEALIGDNHES
jgi:(p)ppGpp synthase/HD superfamily hydrolase